MTVLYNARNENVVILKWGWVPITLNHNAPPSGDESAMLEDMCVTVEELANVSFQVIWLPLHFSVQ